MAGFSPLRTQPKQNINDFLSNILPELLKQKMQLDQVKKQAEIWLQNQLKEYEAYGEIQSKQGKESFMRETLGKFVTPDFVKGLPMPSLQLAKIMQQHWPPEKVSEVGINIPPGAEAELANAIASMTNLGQSRQTLESFPAEQMAPLIRVFGEKPLLEVIDQIRTEKQKAAELGIRAGELTEAGKSRVLRGEEIGVRGKELEAEQPAGKKALAAKLEKRMGEANDYVDQYLGIKGGQMGMPKVPKDKVIGQIERVMADIKQLRKSLGIKEPPNMSELVSRLKKAGYTKESLLENIQLRSSFINQGIDPLIFLQYLDFAPKKK